MVGDKWTEMSYEKYKSRPQFERYDYESWDFDIDEDETEIDYEIEEE